jgi:hypothetical protein
MTDISKMKKRMAVIAADGRRIGFVSRMAPNNKIRLTSLSASHGYDHLIPVEWVSLVDKYVYLSKGSRFIADNWENIATAPIRRNPVQADLGDATRLTGTIQRPAVA